MYDSVGVSDVSLCVALSYKKTFFLSLWNQTTKKSDIYQSLTEAMGEIKLINLKWRNNTTVSASEDKDNFQITIVQTW